MRIVLYFVLICGLLAGALMVAFLVLFVWKEPLILLPSSESSSAATTSAVLAYLPGANVPIESYTPICQAIQAEFQQNGVSLTCVLIRYPKLLSMDMPPFWDPESIITAVMPLLSETPKHLFVGGHSLGAILGQIIAYKEASLYSYSGVLLHSGFVMDSYRKQQGEPLRVPTITISGSRDGLNRLTYLAMQYSASLQDSPALVIDGMNHMQIANSFENDYTTPRDLQATISLQEALSQTATYSATFLLNCMTPQAQEDSPKMDELLALAESSGRNYFAPYIAALRDDVSGRTCVQVQEIHFQSDASAREIYVADPYVSKYKRVSFVFSKPRGNDTHVMVQSFATKARTLFGRSSVPQAIQILNCKVMTRPQLFQTASDYPKCSQINALLAEQTLSTLTAPTKAEYESSRNYWTFADDFDYTNGFKWSFTSTIKFLSSGNGYELILPRLTTEPGLGRYGGKLNCALISKSNLIEHVLIDAHRLSAIVQKDDDKTTEEL